ncbi:phage portal protein [Bremerella sp. P1]|uniref:phage portal protein n=1 Tax=Bremerella sp. P1 TaxID=3026424 RepID=UPI00236839CA|nr:phage portal protein [Bremerella sp. P1]WDI41832.1 phage portal protein [Bremerella sp. P1]
MLHVTQEIESRSLSVGDGIEFMGFNLEDILKGTANAAGVRVTAESILGNPAVKKGLDTICGSIGQVPFKVYKADGNNSTVARNHPAHWLLTQQPAENLTPIVWKQSLLHDAIIYGNGYSMIMRDALGNPTELLWLDPDATYPDKSNGPLAYVTTLGNRQFRISPNDVIHIRSLSRNGGVSGEPLFQLLRTSLGLGLATIEYGARYFKNNGKPSVVIELSDHVANNAEKFKDFKEKWKEAHEGVENSQRPALIYPGMKVTPITVANNEGQWIESREADLVAVANALNLPASWVNSQTNTSYKSLEMDQQNLVSQTLGPWFTQLDQELTLKLCSNRQLLRGTHWIEAERKALIQTDAQKEIDLIVQQVSNGLLSWEEARELLNRPTEKSQEFFMVTNVAKMFEPEPEVEAPMDEVQAPGEDVEEPDNRLSKLTDTVVRKLVKRVAKSVEAHAKKDDWQEYLERLREEHSDIATSQLEPAFGTRANTFVDEWLSELKEELQATSRADLEKVFQRQYENIPTYIQALGA